MLETFTQQAFLLRVTQKRHPESHPEILNPIPQNLYPVSLPASPGDFLNLRVTFSGMPPKQKEGSPAIGPPLINQSIGSSSGLKITQGGVLGNVLNSANP